MINPHVFVFRLSLIAASKYWAGLYQARAPADRYCLPINSILVGWQRTIAPRAPTCEDLAHGSTLSQPMNVCQVFNRMLNRLLSKLTQEVV